MTWLYIPPFLTVTRCRSGWLAVFAAIYGGLRWLALFAAIYGGLGCAHAALRLLFP
jgi:hypothetical protein